MAAVTAILAVSGCNASDDRPEASPTTTQRVTQTPSPTPSPPRTTAPPRFENARIVVRPGHARAYVGFTITGSGDNQYARPDDITVTLPDGSTIPWKHQTATGGPPEIAALKERVTYPPGSEDGGDADYIDAADVRAGQTVTIRFVFIRLDDNGNLKTRAVAKVPFKVVAG